MTNVRAKNKNAIKKYGVENFKKEIIAECSSFEEMNNLEKELVNQDFVNNPNNASGKNIHPTINAMVNNPHIINFNNATSLFFCLSLFFLI